MSVPSIPVSEIRPNPHNPRRDVGDVTELAASIKAVGLLQPLVVTQVRGGWMLIDGHRRLAAAKLAGRDAVPCVAIKPGDTGRDTALALAAAMHKQLAPLERAHAFKQLRDEQLLTITEIALRTGYGVRTVTDSLRLLFLPKEAQQLIAEGRLGVGEATELAKQVEVSRTGSVTRSHLATGWFTPGHPLAAAARRRCTHRNEVPKARRIIGDVACGECWEDTIRADALAGSGGAS